MGKPKFWRNDRQLTEVERAVFREEQRAAVLEAMATYNSSAMIVFGPDLGHTDPQYVIPFGGSMTVDTGPTYHRGLLSSPGLLDSRKRATLTSVDKHRERVVPH
jgi:hypothetical protein